jgi:ribosomal protein L21E
MTFKVGDRVRVKKSFRREYDGATRGTVRQLNSAGSAVKVELNAGNPPARWVDPAHLEKEL